MDQDERASLAAAAVSSALAPVFRGRLCDVLLDTRTPRTFERHAVLYDLGETDRTLFFIRNGVVKTGTITQEGREIIYDVRKDGDVVGELCALDTSRRDRAVAVEATGAIVIGFEEVVATLAGNVLLLTNFIAALSGVLADAYAQLNRVVRGDVSHGLIAVLKTLARKLGRPNGSLVEIDAYLHRKNWRRWSWRAANGYRPHSTPCAAAALCIMRPTGTCFLTSRLLIGGWRLTARRTVDVPMPLNVPQPSAYTPRHHA